MRREDEVILKKRKAKATDGISFLKTRKGSATGKIIKKKVEDMIE